MTMLPAWKPAAGTWQPGEALAAIAAAWEGDWTNHRQVHANQERGGPPAPELTQERREMQVVRLEAPQLGNTVLFFEEFRESQPGLAHRQRVVSLVVAEQPAEEEGAALVRAQQLFFRAGPTYDRPPLRPADVAQLSPADFRREPGCDLLFTWDSQHQRWRASMRPCACQYHHPSSGLVYAEFAMLLLPDQLWYRDRSLVLSDHRIRGEVDGFSWLLFDRVGSAVAAAVPPPIQAIVEPGVYAGTFRRYDAEGDLIEQFPAEIVVRLQQQNGRVLYHQTNLYMPADRPAERLDSHGEIRNGKLWFSNERLRGWSLPVPGAGGCRAGVLMMEFIDGSGLSLHELVVISADGQRRSRTAQYLREGRLVRRTLIDERRRSVDWQAWDRAHDSLRPE
ncbi:MAG: CpcT/CpeT family chromophore lyase [Synechococcaceae cyanobacterium]